MRARTHVNVPLLRGRITAYSKAWFSPGPLISLCGCFQTRVSPCKMHERNLKPTRIWKMNNWFMSIILQELLKSRDINHLYRGWRSPGKLSLKVFLTCMRPSPLVVVVIKFESFYRGDIPFTSCLLNINTRLCCVSKNESAFELPRKYIKIMLWLRKNSLVFIILVVFNFICVCIYSCIYVYIHTHS